MTLLLFAHDDSAKDTEYAEKATRNSAKDTRMSLVKVGDRKIADGEPVFIIAEVGVNHNGSLALGHAHVRAAKTAGCDAVKLQTYRAGALAARESPLYWDGAEGSQYQAFAKLDGLPFDEARELMAAAGDLGMVGFSTPFDMDAVDALEAANVPLYKIASADITYLDLLMRVADTGKPIILSTGASDLWAVEEAIRAITANGNEQIILMGCTLKYPTPIDEANLGQLADLRKNFPFPVGLSDHTESVLVPALAVALGAVCIEKHFTVDRTLGGSPDHNMSADPEMMAELVRNVRLAERAMLGSGKKVVLPCEARAYAYARRSVVAARPIPSGKVLERADLTCKRPGTGIAADQLENILGRAVDVDVEEDTVLTYTHLAPAGRPEVKC